MMVKSGLEKIFWNSSMRRPFSSNSFYFPVLRHVTISVRGRSQTTFTRGGGRWSKKDKFCKHSLWTPPNKKLPFFCMEENWIYFFATYTWPNWPVRAISLLRFQFEGETDVWISQIRHVKGYNPQHYLLGSTNQAWLDSYSTKSWIISYLTPRWCNFALSKWSLDSDLLSSLSFAKLFGTSRVWVKKYTIKVKFQFNHVK